MQSRVLLASLLAAATWTSCAAPPPAVLPSPTTEVALASPSAGRPRAEPVVPGTLTGALFLTVTDESGFVYPVNQPGTNEARSVDLQAIDACYAGFVAAQPQRVAGLPGWARYRTTKAMPGGITVAESLGDSGLPEALRGCLQTALARTDWSADTTVKEITLSFR